MSLVLPLIQSPSVILTREPICFAEKIVVIKTEQAFFVKRNNHTVGDLLPSEKSLNSTLDALMIDTEGALF